MKKLIHWPSLLIGLGVAALIAVLVNACTALGFWPIFVIVVVAILVNGVVATVEDEMPGGFNNPGPASPLPLVAPQRWKLWLCEPPRDLRRQIGRAQVCTPVTNAHLVCRLLLEKKQYSYTKRMMTTTNRATS